MVHCNGLFNSIEAIMRSIDYGLGKTNIDTETGIRFGVQKINSLHECIHDDLEMIYPEPCCTKCGGEFTDDPDYDYWCASCEDYSLESDFHDAECIGSELTGKYEAHSAFDHSCLFLTKSPYYTYANLCSPCAPGAGDLDSYTEPDYGYQCYCFGPEMFDDNKAPYPIWKVADNTLVTDFI
jgi:hypothetical protein